jgi:hypothetical protein
MRLEVVPFVAARFVGRRMSEDTDYICSPAAFAPVVAGGAVIGALVGAVVYAARRSARDRPSRMRRASLD